MSDTGVHSGVFGQLSKYSRILNQFLVELKLQEETQPLSPPEPIKELIMGLNERWHSDLAIQALSNGLDSHFTMFNTFALRRLHKAIQGSNNYPKLIEDLEGLSKLVSSQQSGAYARLRLAGEPLADNEG